MKHSVFFALAISLMIGTSAGCDRRNTLISLMEVSLSEQFELACDNDTQCVTAVTTYGEKCFDRGLAAEAIDAEPAKQKDVNTRHILQMQRCFAESSGKDYWADLDMPTTILSQVDN